MMRTDDARVSLEDTFNSESDSPENSGKGSAKAVDKKPEGKQSKPGCGVGAWIGGETWEEVGTSWVLTDALLLLWRVAAFGTVMGLFIAKARSGAAEQFSRDCYVGAVLATGLLLVPCGMLLLHGPHFDDLDAREVRWVWGVVCGGLQIVVSNVVFVTAGFAGIVGRRGDAWHYVLVGVLVVEYLVGCVVPKVGYGLLAWGMMGIEVLLAGEGWRGGLGEWANVWFARGGGVRYVGAMGVQGGVVVVVFGVGRLRKFVAEKVERAGETF